MKKDIETVYFYYESSGIGGAQLLFARMALMLNNAGVSVGVVSKEKCYIKSYLQSYEIDFKYLRRSSNLFPKIKENDILVIPLSYVGKLNAEISPDNTGRLFIWDLHPNNLIDNTVFSYFYRRSVSTVLMKAFKIIEKTWIAKLIDLSETSCRKASLRFMCKANRLECEKFFEAKFPGIYLPIGVPLEEKVEIYRDSTCEKNSLVVAWLGRLDLGKVPSLNYLIEDLDRWLGDARTRLNVILKVIGDGPKSEDVIKPKNFSIDFLGFLGSAQLTDYFIYNKVDIGLAMGTSAIEFAGRGIVTYLVPGPVSYPYYHDKNKRYLCFLDAEEYDVAVERYHFSKCVSIGDVLIKGQFASLDEKKEFYNFALANHSLYSIAGELIEALGDSDLTLQELRSKLMPSRLEKVLFFLKHLVSNAVRSNYEKSRKE